MMNNEGKTKEKKVQNETEGFGFHFRAPLYKILIIEIYSSCVRCLSHIDWFDTHRASHDLAVRLISSMKRKRIDLAEKLFSND